MLDHTAVKQALRNRLLAIVVCTTGVMSLRATATGYARDAGSFLVDGFAPGMELTRAGFGSAVVEVVEHVTALELTVSTPHAVQALAAGRSLSVGLPQVRIWENVDVVDGADPMPDGVASTRPYIDEQYLRGPNALQTIGPSGRLLAQPLYLPRINVPLGIGDDAAARYADAIVNAYPPSDVIALAGGNTIHIRGDVAPYAGQLLRSEGGGHVGILCTVPVRCYSINSI